MDQRCIHHSNFGRDGAGCLASAWFAARLRPQVGPILSDRQKVTSKPPLSSESLETAVSYNPYLWRWWGIAGCLGSLFFYLIEYFPFTWGFI